MNELEAKRKRSVRLLHLASAVGWLGWIKGEKPHGSYARELYWRQTEMVGVGCKVEIGR